MAIANIELKIYSEKDSANIILESGTLKYIDSVIKNFNNAEELKHSPNFQEKISFLSSSELRNSRIILTYIKNNNEKVQLKPIYNDSRPILTRVSAIDEEKSETEKARKLLFSSRNNLFLTMFLNNQTLLRTTYGTMKMTISEYKCAKEKALSTFIKDGEYRVIMRDVLRYRLNNKKLGVMRTLFEDTLEEWKKHMLNLSEEDLYFYSRELRVLMNEYDYKKFPRRAVYNLSFNKINFDKLNDFKINKNIEVISSGVEGIYKKKILEDKKAV